ncbi:uncharacterized protein LOC104907389 [Beta vulgaris subsp. vulgaris]|uniref:uncharacterized protein LOC104907389 n=1 Tax=Beta vulgaris subsp. vulgaris TaxID=3555 RepID=UPI0025496986|nr:uncharacterized protein LOC104907389 [Beta vulgaris subsp. vulgaris]
MWIKVHGPRFTLEHAWNVLKHYDKWTYGTQLSGGSSKRSGPDEGVSSKRPDGVKKVKSRRKAPISSSTSPSSLEITTRRISVGEDLLEYQKERDALRESTKEEDRKFKIWNILMAKSSLDPDEREINEPLYPENIFRRRFRMHKHVFLRIVEGVTIQDAKFFVQKPDATGRMGASKLQKCTAAIRMLAYGSSSDAVDEYLKIASSTARECLLHFVEAVVARFGDEYLRKANANDIERLLHEGERRGFPGMMGSIDCMHWNWKNCPRGWKGMYQGRSKTTTIILEAVASSDLWIWHAFFGTRVHAMI